MRQVIYSVAASLDGYIAGPQGEFDWIPMDPAIDWAGFMGRFDTVLVGRKTYEVAAGQADGAAASPGLHTYVFSRTLHNVDAADVTVVRDKGLELIEKLRRSSGKAIWLMGGGVLFRSLLEAGLVDKIEVAVAPILLGEGLPLLPSMPRRTQLALTDTQKYASGLVTLAYDVRRSGG